MAKYPEYSDADRERLAKLMGRPMRDSEDKQELGLRDGEDKQEPGVREEGEAQNISTVLPDGIVERIRELIEWVQEVESQAMLRGRELPDRVSGNSAAALDELFHDIEMFFRQESQPKVVLYPQNLDSVIETIKENWKTGPGQIIPIPAEDPFDDSSPHAKISNWRKALEYHNKANPTHGEHCICMDRYSRMLRRMLNIPKPPYTMEDQERLARAEKVDGGMGLAAELDSGEVGIVGHGVDMGDEMGGVQYEGLDEETGCKHKRHVNPHAFWLDSPQAKLARRLRYIIGMISRNP